MFEKNKLRYEIRQNISQKKSILCMMASLIAIVFLEIDNSGLCTSDNSCHCNTDNSCHCSSTDNSLLCTTNNMWFTLSIEVHWLSAPVTLSFFAPPYRTVNDTNASGQWHECRSLSVNHTQSITQMQIAKCNIHSALILECDLDLVKLSWVWFTLSAFVSLTVSLTGFKLCPF